MLFFTAFALCALLMGSFGSHDGLEKDGQPASEADAAPAAPATGPRPAEEDASASASASAEVPPAPEELEEGNGAPGITLLLGLQMASEERTLTPEEQQTLEKERNKVRHASKWVLGKIKCSKDLDKRYGPGIGGVMAAYCVAYQALLATRTGNPLRLLDLFVRDLTAVYQHQYGITFVPEPADSSIKGYLKETYRYIKCSLKVALRIFRPKRKPEQVKIDQQKMVERLLNKLHRVSDSLHKQDEIEQSPKPRRIMAGISTGFYGLLYALGVFIGIKAIVLGCVSTVVPCVLGSLLLGLTLAIIAVESAVGYTWWIDECF